MKTSLIFLLILTTFLLVNSVSALEISPLSLNTQQGQITTTTFTIRSSQPVHITSDSALVTLNPAHLPNGTNAVIVTVDFTKVTADDPAILGSVTFTEEAPQQAASVSISSAIQINIKNSGGKLATQSPTITPKTTQKEITPVPTEVIPTTTTNVPVDTTPTMFGFNLYWIITVAAIIVIPNIIYWLFIHRYD